MDSYISLSPNIYPVYIERERDNVIHMPWGWRGHALTGGVLHPYIPIRINVG